MKTCLGEQDQYLEDARYTYLHLRVRRVTRARVVSYSADVRLISCQTLSAMPTLASILAICMTRSILNFIRRLVHVDRGI